MPSSKMQMPSFDGRMGAPEYIGVWQGRFLLVVAEGDVEDDDDILVLNVIHHDGDQTSGHPAR
ncbi:MAG: hypothetical protein IT306_21635 [Chloroflexi bacterium]|nr:hypothetical protein [Chloroflexota bacterium]